jgi:hypothetical protein
VLLTGFDPIRNVERSQQDANSMSEIPTIILEEIHAAACEQWPHNKRMQDHMIEGEMQGYLVLQTIDFDPALSVKDAILKDAEESWHTWKERASFVRDEIEAFAELQATSPEDVPANIVSEAKVMAEADSGWYSMQLNYVERILQRYRDNQRTRAKVEPIRQLLLRMERIIGNCCYNGNIQNYQSWGVLESTGRSFRYPVTFAKQDGTGLKRWDAQEDLAPEMLITGHYKFGANEMSIYRALVAIVYLLQDEYGLRLPDASRSEAPTS